MIPNGDGKPLDVEALKEIVRIAAKQLNKVKESNDEALFTLALGLTAAVKKTLYELAEAKFSREPIIEKRGIVQFVKRMRVDAMEKFNQTSVFSAVHYYLDTKQLDKDIPVGLIIIYMEKKFIPETLRLLKYPYIDYDDDDEVKDGCGAIANLVAGQFKKEFIALGYKDLEMSHFQSFINSAPDGINFPIDQNQKYEISFHIDEVKRLVVEMIMGDIPKI